jgi:hypothetical protein
MSGDPGEHGIEGLESRLARIESLLSIGFERQVSERREREDIGDAVSHQVLLRARAWTPAGELKQAVINSTGQSEPTVKRRFNKLVDLGALERRGKGPSTEYRNTGLFG